MKIVCYQTAVEQFNGREGETATLLFGSSCFPDVACIRFRPTSSQPFGVSRDIIVFRNLRER